MQTAAWVGIVAGVVFVVAVVFFSGALLGWSSGGDFVGHRIGWVDGNGGGAGTCPMMNQGDMMKPGEMGPMGRMHQTPSPPTSAPRP